MTTTATFPFRLGTVMPEEYDWKLQILEIVEVCDRSGELWAIVDMGKLYGLAMALEGAEMELRDLRHDN